MCRGQYYPTLGYLNLTMVDLGEGFLPLISKVTKNTENPILTSKEAVIWAVNGHSVKPYTLQEPGGQGISGIFKFCKGNHGILQIATRILRRQWISCKEPTDPRIVHPSEAYIGTPTIDKRRIEVLAKARIDRLEYNKANQCGICKEK